MVPYREESADDRGGPLVLRLPRSWTSHRTATTLGGALFLILFSAVLAVGIVLCLDAHLVVLAFGCFFGAVVASMVSMILLFRALIHLRRWRGVELAVQIERTPLVGETIEARIYLIGRKRVPSVTLNLYRDDTRVQLASLADVGRIDVGVERRIVQLTIPSDASDGCELEVVADDLSGEPFVERFRLPFRRGEI